MRRIPISKYPSKLTIKARKKSDNYAEFIDKTFALQLADLEKRHRELIGTEKKYASNYNETGFYFKSKNLLHYDNNIIVMSNCLLDKTAFFDIKINPYSFTNDKEVEYSGISILVLKISY